MAAVDLEPADNQAVESGSAERGPDNQPDSPIIRRGPGGRRPGAGRPPGSRDRVPRVAPARRATFREMYDNEVERNAPRIIRAAIRQATRGDSRALVDVLNRVLGPPAQRVEMSGPGGAPLALQAAAPVALALMSTEELRALLGLQARLGLPDVQLEPVRDLLASRPPDGAPGLLADELHPAAEPGHDQPLTPPPVPLPLSLVPDPLDSPGPPRQDNPGDNPQPADEQPADVARQQPDAAGQMGEDAPARALHPSTAGAGTAGQPAASAGGESAPDGPEPGAFRGIAQAQVIDSKAVSDS